MTLKLEYICNIHMPPQHALHELIFLNITKFTTLALGLHFVL